MKLCFSLYFFLKLIYISVYCDIDLWPLILIFNKGYLFKSVIGMCTKCDEDGQQILVQDS